MTENSGRDTRQPGAGSYTDFKRFDESGITRFHLRTLVVSGMGFFADAYDLFVIGALLPAIAIYFGLSHTSLDYAFISSSALLGAVVGPLILGPLSDRFGRRAVYGVDLAILILAAIGSSFSQTPLELILWRFLLGVGVGGDYPVSATLMSEFSNRRDRGRLVSAVFAMQGFGLLTGAVVSLLCLLLHMPFWLVWRIPLALGAVPALAVFFARRRVGETPRFLAQSKKTEIHAGNGHFIVSESNANLVLPRREILSNYVPLILGTAICWFALDVAFYGTSIFSNTMINEIISVHATAATEYTYLIHSTEITSTVFALFAFPGYWAAVFLIDNVGRRALQLLGFSFMVGAYAAISAVPALLSNVIYLIAVYGSSFFFINFGPNTTTFVVPVEVFPTQVRTTGHGIAASAGKTGAFISTFLFPFALEAIHISGVFAVLSVVSLVGVLVTAILIPEGSARRLESISGEERLLRTYSEFSDLILKLADKTEDASQELKRFVDNWGDTAILAKNIKGIEHECDEIVHSVFVRLNSKIIAPINRMDIVTLTQGLDDIMDYLEAATARFSMYDIKEPTQPMRRFADVIAACISEVRQGIRSINDIYSRRFDRIENSCIKINQYENEGDEILREALEELFRSGDAIEIIKLKEIYDNLETVTDKCEDVADILRDLIVKYRRT
ncbi:MAG: MFS transporter [Methanomassiliicoccales archaeon]